MGRLTVYFMLYILFCIQMFKNKLNLYYFVIYVYKTMLNLIKSNINKN